MHTMRAFTHIRVWRILIFGSIYFWHIFYFLQEKKIQSQCVTYGKNRHFLLIPMVPRFLEENVHTHTHGSINEPRNERSFQGITMFYTELVPRIRTQNAHNVSGIRFTSACTRRAGEWRFLEQKLTTVWQTRRNSFFFSLSEMSAHFML